jgi:hypothetical protein
MLATMHPRLKRGREGGVKQLANNQVQALQNTIPQEFDLLRTIQFTECGYNKVI